MFPKGQNHPPIENHCSRALGPLHPGSFSHLWHLSWEVSTSSHFCTLWHASIPLAYVPGIWGHLLGAGPTFTWHNLDLPRFLRNQNKIAHFSFCSYLRKRQTPPRLEGDWGFLVGISVLRTGMMRSEFIFKLRVAFVWRGRANFAEQEVNEGVLSGAGCRSGLALCLCCWLSEWLPPWASVFSSVSWG